MAWLSVARLSHDLEIGFAIDECCQPFANGRVVVHNCRPEWDFVSSRVGAPLFR
jgi:hypothetical protein